MAVPTTTQWTLDPHSKAKHAILRRYLSAWFPIIAGTGKNVIYVDGFAGPGRYETGEHGSPVIALTIASTMAKTNPHLADAKCDFWFFEPDQARAKNLSEELSSIAKPPGLVVRVENRSFAESLDAVLESGIQPNGNQSPMFAFIDPFGFSGIPFAVIEKILRRPSSEVFVNFMVDSINRFIEHPNDKIVAHISDVFGGPDVTNRALAQPGDRILRLRELYQSQLQGVAKYVRYFEMRDARDRRQYYLFFATNNLKGYTKMKEAMWKVDRSGGFHFSDATNPAQSVLFEADPIPVLQGTLRKQFCGCGYVLGRDVRLFIEEQTAFVKTHMTKALIAEETVARLQVDPIKADGGKRRSNTYPDDVRLKWA